MISPISAVSPRAATPSAAAATSTDPLAQEQTFLKLLVAQVQNQDPLNPTQDPTQYVTQLAQFSSLEQMTQMRTDLDTLVSSTKAATVKNSTQEQS